MRNKKITSTLSGIVLSLFLSGLQVFAVNTETQIDLSAGNGPDFTLEYNSGQSDAFILTAGGIHVSDQLFMINQSGCGVTTPPSRQFPVWSMVGTSGTTGYEDGSGWITISMSADATITGIEVIAISASSGGANFIAGFSQEASGGNYSAGEFAGFLPTRCDSYTFLSPSGMDVKSVRLERNRNFAGQQTNDVSGAANIKSIKVYTEYIQTKVENPEDSGFRIVITPEEIQATQDCRMELYDISGRIVDILERAEVFPVRDLPSGIYVIKAIHPSGTVVVNKFTK
ncbi:MAG: T9SS type A sorting domain-containing protein [Candidatus Azobacteroides sp.]|nr:T9SS type A sorting domain-containing protein [Candidatus Azobacteroides sp.]